MPTTSQLKQFEKAVVTGDFEKAHELLVAGCTPESTDKDGWTAAGRAIQSGRSGVLQVMLDHGLNGGLSGTDGITLLHVAAMYHKLYLVRMLLKNGAKAKVKDDNGHTPSDVCRDEEIKLLLAMYDPKEDDDDYYESFFEGEQVYCQDKQGMWWPAVVSEIKPGHWYCRSIFSHKIMLLFDEIVALFLKF
eukprot:m.19432 g.19432  ORF g.19432 m.19432 type:complete len:190 (-) comp5116_c0_seq2:1341-1910(-)